ncbi:MAG: isochorismatase family protein [Sedimentisphaerales bacterium]|nr:isochorismatase family protein [Sedimentisphaerales bacterium]
MRANRAKSLLSIIATATSGVLILIYWLAPAEPGSHRLHILLIDCIPDAVIVLIAIPIVYWLFYRRGLTNMGDCPLFSEDGDAKMPVPPVHQCDKPARAIRQKTPAAADKRQDEPVTQQDVLLVVDAEGGLAGSARTLSGLNAAIRTAEARDMPVLFACERCAGKQEDDARAGHTDTAPPAAEFPCGLYRPAGSTVFALDADPDAPGGAVANPALEMVLSHRRIRTVYVAAIAPAHVVQATCRGILQRRKKAVLLEAATAGVEQADTAWHQLAPEGLARIDRLPPAGQEPTAP